MRRRHLESVSSRSLSVRGSWGTVPSVFWYGVPGGTQGPLGKGGAAERWRVAYPIGIATRHGAKPATTHTSKRNAPPASRTGFAPCKINAPPLGDHNLGLIFLLPTFLHRKVGPRRRAVLTMPLQRAPPAEGEMKLRHGFCRQSLRLISFATSLCTRKVFAVRRLQTFPRRAGVLAKPCKRLRPAARCPPIRPKTFSLGQVCMDREKNRPTVFPLLRGRAPEFAGIRAEHLSDHGKSGKSPAVSGERFCWTGPVRPL